MFDVPAHKADEKQPIQKKHCKLCGTLMSWPSSEPGHILVSSCDVEGWDTCRDCIEEHCAQTNCFGCTHCPTDGNYKNCEFFSLKQNALAAKV